MPFCTCMKKSDGPAENSADPPERRESVCELLAGLGDLVDTDGEHRNNIDKQEAPADGAVTLGNQAGQTEGGDRDTHKSQADGDDGTNPCRRGLAAFIPRRLQRWISRLES